MEMGDWEDQALPPSLVRRLAVRAEVVTGTDEVVLYGLAEAAPFPALHLTSLQAMALGEALYLAGASAGWARFRREAGERRG